ncbi:uncharacterized protein OCT59_011230 [Rhizophagus irregularis]|uniref:uncharacterized protein n=1 Tax=Rhizophagus irregularis TaxID=588596 RepID=UPI003333A102|nr:hypothetical protein OCT59_011230 [Rhizophagus irregularis]
MSKRSLIVFKSSDYDLNEDERKLKYKDYNIIVCEKCNDKFNRGWKCRKCYINETEEEKYRMLYGICKGCSQVKKIPRWCSSCNSNRLRQDFDRWTSGNDYVDKLIKDNQTSAYSNHILEWIPYEKFTDLKFIAKGGNAKVYSATWTDGQIEKWDYESNIWKRSESFEIALKILNNSKDLSEEFLNELKFLKKFFNYCYKYIIKCFGITREPGTLNYALVFELKKSSLRDHLDNHYSSLTLKDKLDIIEHICLGLNCIIINEIIFGNRPFNSRPYDEYLVIDICKGLRPNIRDKTPEPLKEIIQKCWDENPKNRPNTDKIYDMLRNFIYTKNEGNKEHPYNFRKYTKQYEDNKNLSYDLINELTIIISPPELQEKNQSQSPNASSIIIVETTKTAYTVNSDGCSDCGIVDHLSVIQQGSVHRIEYIEVQ